MKRPLLELKLVFCERSREAQLQIHERARYVRRREPGDVGMSKRADAIERERKCFARQCIDHIPQHVNTLDTHVADERERQMDVGVDDRPAAGAQGNVTSQSAKQCLRCSVGNEREKDAQRPHLRRSFHREIVTSARRKNNGDASSRRGAPRSGDRRSMRVVTRGRLLPQRFSPETQGGRGRRPPQGTARRCRQEICRMP
jgi:hypothetical protein